MTFKLTAKFFFDGGQVKKVDWLEHDLVKRGNDGTKDVEIPLTRDEVEVEFRKLFLKYAQEKKVLSIPNILGEISIIPFGKIYYATVAVSDYNGEPVAEEDGVRID